MLLIYVNTIFLQHLKKIKMALAYVKLMIYYNNSTNYTNFTIILVIINWLSLCVHVVGKHDGLHHGKRFFKCPPRHGIFVPLEQIHVVRQVYIHLHLHVHVHTNWFLYICQWKFRTCIMYNVYCMGASQFYEDFIPLYM